MSSIGRRKFLSIGMAAGASTMLTGAARGAAVGLEFNLSLVETSLARSLRTKTIDHLDFVRVAKEELEIKAVEYASPYFPDGKPPNKTYLKELNKRAAAYGVRQLLIAVEREIRVADPVEANRQKAIQDVRRWIDTAKALGCHSVQVNPTSSGTADEQSKRAIDAVSALCEYADLRKVNLLLGNYGSLSANAEWIEGIVNAVEAPCCRTIPLIKNLREDADYENVAQLVPLAKGLTANTSTFDNHGNETSTDYARAIRVIHKAGYRGYVGINFRGKALDEMSGIRASKKLLETIRNRAAG